MTFDEYAEQELWSLTECAKNLVRMGWNARGEIVDESECLKWAKAVIEKLDPNGVGMYPEDLAKEVMALSTKKTSRSAVPDGWKLVPINMTDEMWDACQHWETWQAARAQGGQGAEPVITVTNLHAEDSAQEPVVTMSARNWLRLSQLPPGTKLYTHRQPAQQGVPDLVIAGDRLCRELESWMATEHDRESQDAIAAWKRLRQRVVTPQPEGDGWIKCSVRLPAEADGSLVWSHDQKRGTVELCSWAWSHSLYKHDHITHWKPTGLKRPNPPDQGADDRE